MTDPRDEVMGDVYWSFSRKRYPDPAAFREAVSAYQLEIHDGPNDAWRPDEIAIPAPEIAVLYQAVRGDAMDDARTTLRADSARGFTQAELLWKLHEALAGDDLADHHFFEGLSRFAAGRDVWLVHQGS